MEGMEAMEGICPLGFGNFCPADPCSASTPSIPSIQSILSIGLLWKEKSYQWQERVWAGLAAPVSEELR